MTNRLRRWKNSPEWETKMYTYWNDDYLPLEKAMLGVPLTNVAHPEGPEPADYLNEDTLEDVILRSLNTPSRRLVTTEHWTMRWHDWRGLYSTEGSVTGRLPEEEESGPW